MGDLVRKAGRGEVSAPVTPDVGVSKNVDHGSWSGTSLAFEDVAPDVGPPLSPLVAEAASLEDKARRRKSGDYLRRRWGWRADRTGFVLVRQEQALGPLPDGRFKPFGPWRNTERMRFEAAEVGRRVGDVACDADSATYDTDPAVQGRTGAPAMHRDLEYLPTNVREGYVAAVVAPTFEGALALRWSNDERVLRHTVTALRMDSSRAVVIQASRQAGANTWQVEQVTYQPLRASASTGVNARAPHHELGRT